MQLFVLPTAVFFTLIPILTSRLGYFYLTNTGCEPVNQASSQTIT